jgi:putative flippase GtrA
MNMIKKDLILSLVVGIIVAIFAPVVLNNLDLKFLNYSWIQFYIASFLIFPLGAMVAFFIGAQLSEFRGSLLQITKFVEVGTMNTVTDFGILNSLILLTGHKSGAWVVLFNTISFSLAVVNSYFWNKKWTFEQSQSNKNNVSQFTQFVLVTLIGLIISNIIISLFQWIRVPANISADQWLNISKVLATLVSLVWNFLGYKLIVFKKNATNRNNFSGM